MFLHHTAVFLYPKPTSYISRSLLGNKHSGALAAWRHPIIRDPLRTPILSPGSSNLTVNIIFATYYLHLFLICLFVHVNIHTPFQ
jgi:hypothetical protein